MPLWSARKELSNDVLKIIFNFGHFFVKNHTGSKFNGHHWNADHNGAIPSFISPP